MTPEPSGVQDKIPDDKSVIVVSDHHLGLTDDKQVVGRNFAGFLNYVKTLRPKGTPGGSRTVLVDGKEQELYAPAQVILLGDIVDLWSPRGNQRSSVFADCAPIFSALAGLDAEVVYVTGNHDDEIADIIGTYPVAPPHNLTIARRHYPPNGETVDGTTKYTGMDIGGKRYFFMHGQQFDILFNTAGILQDYPGWVAKNYQLFRDNPFLAWFFRGLFILTLAVSVAHALLPFITPFDGIVLVLLGISLVIVLFSIEPSVFRNFWDSINRKKTTKNDTIETIIEQGFWMREAGKDLLAEVIVFGHTHIVDDSKGRYLDDYGKRFINSGAWEEANPRTHDGKSESETNTFVYIDAGGPLLFYWPVDEAVPEEKRRPVHIPVTLTGDKKGELAKASPAALWIRRNLFTKG
jgi:UDP-2,3-diacylglucosamine pyrophosphatase LpxH